MLSRGLDVAPLILAFVANHSHGRLCALLRCCVADARLNLDLAWLAEAAPLMSGLYWSQRGTRRASTLGLASTSDGALEGKPAHKVGRRFEQVHLRALRSTPGVEVLAANAPLRAERRTLGELDILYRKDGLVIHREVAVKYYLAAKPGSEPGAWFGPGRRDRLDIKLDRLATHQTTVSTQARKAGVWPEDLPFPDETEVLLLGTLFSPVDDERLPLGADPNADHGRWYYASDFAERFNNAPWCILPKPWWLSPEHARRENPVSAKELAQNLPGPRLVASVSVEVERAFVVPDGWWAEL